MDFLALLRQYGVPFNDPCDEDYRGVCHCPDPTIVAEEILVSEPIDICGTTYPANTDLFTLLGGLCVPNGDDDWRFTAGETAADFIYRTGNVSIGTMVESHQLRVDGQFQFNPVGGQIFDHSGDFRFTGVTNIGVALNYNSITSERDTVGVIKFQVGASDVALIQAVAAGDHTVGNQPTSLEFYVSETDRTSSHLILQNDFRARWTKYGNFDDGVPTFLLGLEANPSNLQTRHPIGGSPDPLNVLRINAAGDGLEYVPAAAASAYPVANGLTNDTTAYVLGGTLDRNTSIVNTGYNLDFGNTTETIYNRVRQSGTLGTFEIFSRNTANNDETSLLVRPESVVLECNQDAIDSILRVSEDEISFNVADGVDAKFLRIVSGAITITGLPEYADDNAASVDAGLPNNALYTVTGSNNLRIK